MTKYCTSLMNSKHSLHSKIIAALKLNVKIEPKCKTIMKQLNKDDTRIYML